MLGVDVGIGFRVRFWHDCWCGDLPLKEVFPALFSCATKCDGTIYSCMIQLGVGRTRVWDVTLNQNLNDWEIMIVAEFFQFINSRTPSGEGMDACR